MAMSFVHKKPVDMEKIAIQHEKQVAIGNMGVNARGDVLGQGGKILKTREEVMKEYYEANPELNPKAVINIKYTKETNAPKQKIDAVMNPPSQPVEEPIEVLKNKKTTKSVKKDEE